MESITNMVYHRNYRRLEKILGDLSEVKNKDYMKFKAPGFMDLSIDILRETDKGFVFSMAHNYEQNGDLVPDPDMEIEIDIENKTAEALTFQNSLFYNEVYTYNEKGEKQFVNVKVKKGVNSFLETWTKNLIEQGYKIEEATE